MYPTLNDLHSPLQRGDTPALDATIRAFGKDAPLLHVAGILGFKHGWESTSTLIAALVRNKVPMPSTEVFGEAQALARAADEGFDSSVKALKEFGEGGASYIARVLDLLGQKEQAEVLRRALGVYLALHAPRALVNKVLTA